MYRARTTIRLGHTDAAGVVYQAEYFRLLHEVYEELLERARFPLAALLTAGRIALPVVRAEADFTAPLRLGDRLSIELSVAELGARHFVLAYRVKRGATLAATARTVHVAVAAETERPCALPAALIRVLRRHAPGAR